MKKQVKKCPVCGEPYNFYLSLDVDQSVCPDCRKKADNKENLNIKE